MVCYVAEIPCSCLPDIPITVCIYWLLRQLLKKMLEAYSRHGRICRRLSFLLIPVSSDNGGIAGHTQGYLKDAEVAYVGTSPPSAEGDHAYEFTYMFKFAIDIPAKATEVILPDNKDIVIFAATLVEEPYAPVKALSTLFPDCQ